MEAETRASRPITDPVELEAVQFLNAYLDEVGRSGRERYFSPEDRHALCVLMAYIRQAAPPPS